MAEHDTYTMTSSHMHTVRSRKFGSKIQPCIQNIVHCTSTMCMLYNDMHMLEVCTFMITQIFPV